MARQLANPIFGYSTHRPQPLRSLTSRSPFDTARQNLESLERMDSLRARIAQQREMRHEAEVKLTTAGPNGGF